MSPEERPSEPDPAGSRGQAPSTPTGPGAIHPDETPPEREVVSATALAAARLLRLRPRHGPRLPGQKVRDPLEIPRWGLMIGILLTFLLFLSLLVLFFLPGVATGGQSHGINFDKPTKDWYQGPVRYIITKVELKAYKSLETDLDRQNFI